MYVNLIHEASRTLFAVVQNEVGEIFDNVSKVFVDAGSAVIGNSAFEVEEVGNRYYRVPFAGDNNILPAGAYNVVFYLQAGGSPAFTDQMIAGAVVNWDGFKEVATKPGNLTVNAQ